MKNLMKYEWKKSLFSKMILLIITAISEIVYLIGVFSRNDGWYKAGLVCLFVCATFGILYIGIESLVTFSKDLNTKQSYMLFLTPHNSYEILGSKVLMNGISILIAGVFYAVLAILDAAIAISYIGGVKEMLALLQSFFYVQIDWNDMIRSGLTIFGVALLEWLYFISVGYLSILLSATVLSGKRGSGFVSVLIFLVINGAAVYLFDTLGDVVKGNAQIWIVAGCAIVLTAIFYGITGWIMEKKLSV